MSPASLPLLGFGCVMPTLSVGIPTFIVGAHFSANNSVQENTFLLKTLIKKYNHTYPPAGKTYKTFKQHNYLSPVCLKCLVWLGLIHIN